jgi:hypothetical protein
LRSKADSDSEANALRFAFNFDLGPSVSDISPILRALNELSGSAKNQPDGNFFAEGTLPLTALELEIESIGKLRWPISQAAAQELSLLSQPAPFGKKSETLIDTNVRDTGEIAAEKLGVHWHADALSNLEQAAANALGLPGLRAELHKLLVYGEGQFFDQHQDTPRLPGMVATLVIVLPSAHIGGELHLRLGDSQAQFHSQLLAAKSMKWFAFYADCRHEVKPVLEGWRVVLTFDLVVANTLPAPTGIAAATLVNALQAHFDAPPQAESPATPLVFLLDHEYHEKGLRWSLLKGKDRARVQSLRAAAASIGLSAQLALAEIHQTWSAEYEYSRSGNHGDATPVDLINEELTLNYWLDSHDRVSAAALRIPVSAIESFSEHDEKFLVDEQFEGYMGNYGDTIDYWYRRAALVLQTPAMLERNRFATDFEQALSDALLLAEQARFAELTQRLQIALDLVLPHATHAGRELWPRYARLAQAVQSKDLALQLCASFEWNKFAASDALPLIALRNIWGAQWLQELLAQWLRKVRVQPSAQLWPLRLGRFIEHAIANGLPLEAVQDLLSQCINAVDAVNEKLQSGSPKDRVNAWPQCEQSILELLSSTAKLADSEADAMVLAIMAQLSAYPKIYRIKMLVPIWQALRLQAARQPEVLALGLAIRQALIDAIASAELPADDCSLLDMDWACQCNDCKIVIDWAQSPNAQSLTIARAEATRTHIERSLQSTAVKFTYQTVKQGSPHKLVIAKPKAIEKLREQLLTAWQYALQELAKES